MLVMSLFFNPSCPLFSHEGHDETPGAVTAPHDGVIKQTEQLSWELVSEPSGVKLYPLTHDLVSISLKEVSVTGLAKIPRKTKKVNVNFTRKEDHFFAKVEVKEVYRYTLELTFTYKGKKETVRFEVEPQN